MTYLTDPEIQVGGVTRELDALMKASGVEQLDGRQAYVVEVRQL
jgi:hypothetical protein